MDLKQLYHINPVESIQRRYFSARRGIPRFLINRFGMKSLQAVGEALAFSFLAQLTPSGERIPISRTGQRNTGFVVLVLFIT